MFAFLTNLAEEKTCLFRILLVCLLNLLVSAFAFCGAQGTSRTVLPNGLTLIIRPRHFSEVVAVAMMAKVSVFDESGGQAGIRYLLQELLVGDTSRNGKADEWGGQIGAEVALDYVEFHASAASGDFEAAIRALANVIQRPDFDGADLARLKKEHRDYLKALREDPFQGTYLLLRRGLYPGHPYGRAAAGEEESVGALSVEGLREFHSRWYVPNNTVVVICGNVGIERARRATEEAFGGWRSRSLPKRERPEAVALEESFALAEEGAVANAHLLIGFSAPAAGNGEEFAAFQVLNSLLGRGMSGRLIEVLRNRLGLAYEISCFYPVLEQSSHFAVYVICSGARIEETRQAATGEINRLLAGPVEKEELEAAKRHLLGQYLLSRQRSRQQAHYLAWYEALGLGAAFEEDYPSLVEKVTPEMLLQTARQYLGKMVIALRLPE